MKKILAGAVVLLAAVLIAGAGRELIWHRFEPPQIVGDIIKSSETDLEALSRTWFEAYSNKLKGQSVPYDYRIRNARIDKTELLTDVTDPVTGLPEPYVQIDYTVYPSSSSEKIVSNLELISTGYSYVYHGQMVLKWKETAENIWVLAEKLSPVQYQLRTPETREEIEEPQTKHYKVRQDEPMTYYIEDGILYVTYDSGDTLTEVPGGYEKVCGTANGLYDELLPGGSYIVTRDFTAFVGYTEGITLLYSTDEGRTWQESSIYSGGFRAAASLSKAGSRCYVTAAVDRSLGSDYYATFRSEDLQAWTQITLPEMLWSNLGCSYWSTDGSGYYGKGNVLYVTKDEGASFEEILIPAAEETAAALGYNPFDTVERIYEEEGMICLTVGQGDDGDYARDGKLMKALYQSQDGIHFTFVSEIDDTPEEAG